MLVNPSKQTYNAEAEVLPLDLTPSPDYTSTSRATTAKKIR